MKISIFGTGYVGLVTGACLANAGHRVICADIDSDKIDCLKQGTCPIVEKDLPARLETGVRSGNLIFTQDFSMAVNESLVIFITVGTPSVEEGQRADLSAVFGVARTIGELAIEPKIVVQKSTVPVGTGGLIERALFKCKGHAHRVVSNPEFLKEGNAIAAFESPDRIVVGTPDENAREVLRSIYKPFNRRSDRIIFMSRSSAELTKVFANTMLAMRISAMNSITELAEEFGADVSEVRQGIGSDSRIGPAFLFPGGATFGGSCFPKDVRALISTMEGLEMEAGLFREILEINHQQRMRFIRKIRTYFNDNLKSKRIVVWGLAFKAGTDDVREAASIDVVACIIGSGGEAVLFDSNARKSFQKCFPCLEVVYENDQYASLKGADALVILTDAMEFRSLDFDKIKENMKTPVVFDGKNLYEPREMADNGIDYVCMGRPYISPGN